jgi:hypothetical protein
MATTAMSPAPDTALPNLRGWAAAQLELAPDAAPAQARAALVRQLIDDDFVPRYRTQQAALFLLQPATGAELLLRQGQAHHDEEDRLRIEVDEFAAEFFKAEVPDRHRRWQQLREECAFCPRLSNRLESLRNGLGVTLPQTDDKLLNDLIRYIAESFPSGLTGKAVRRLELLKPIEDLTVWRWIVERVARLEHELPDVMALAPDLVSDLASWEKRLRPRRVTGVRRVIVESEPAGQRKPVLSRGWIVLAVLMGVVWGALNRSDNPRPYSTPYSPERPQVVYPIIDDKLWRLEPEKPSTEPPAQVPREPPQ